MSLEIVRLADKLRREIARRHFLRTSGPCDFHGDYLLTQKQAEKLGEPKTWVRNPEWDNATHGIRFPKQFNRKQRRMIRLHGTPAEFAQACMATVPEFCSYDEADAAARKYAKEFMEAQ